MAPLMALIWFVASLSSCAAISNVADEQSAHDEGNHPALITAAVHSSATDTLSHKYGFRPWPQQPNQSSTIDALSQSKDLVGPSSFVKMQYHMGPVLSLPIQLYVTWYGNWKPVEKGIIKDFVLSISAPSKQQPSVQKWWSTVTLYNDQTGRNVTGSVQIAGERDDLYSHGKSLTRLSIQEVLKSGLQENNGSFPVNSREGLYLILTANDVLMEDFCRADCGFHYFSFPAIVGHTLPYAWVGHSGTQCPDVCAYPFAIPSYMKNVKPMKAPNGNIGVDGMISVIAHELAEVSSDPLINAWFGGDDPSFPAEIADVCEGIYGSGAGGAFPGAVQTDASGASFNINGINERKFLVQWLWSPILRACYGPNTSN